MKEILVKYPLKSNRGHSINPRWTIEVSEFEPRYGKKFYVLHVVHTGSRAHLASYQIGTGDSSGGKSAVALR